MGTSFRALGREVEPPRRRPSGVSTLLGAFPRALVIVLVLPALLAGCGSEGGAPSPDAPTGTPASGKPDPVSGSPSIEGDTPDQRFQTWLETGGPEVELYEHWLAGQLPGEASSADASDQELQAQFDRWVQGHLRLIRRAWDRAQDKGAQADLRNGLAVALAFAVDQDSFEGFTPREARSIDPSELVQRRRDGCRRSLDPTSERDCRIAHDRECIRSRLLRRTSDFRSGPAG
jgi:hypothetical protein